MIRCTRGNLSAIVVAAVASISMAAMCETAAAVPVPPLDTAIAHWQFTGTAGVFPDPDLNGGQSPLSSMGFVGNTFTVNNAAGAPVIAAANSDQTIGLESGSPPFSFAGVNMSGAGQELVPTANTSYSIFARVRFGAFAGVDDVIRAGDWNLATIDYYALELSSGQARFEVRGSGAGTPSLVTHAALLGTNTWYDLTGVYDSTAQTMTVYVYNPLTGQQIGTPATLGSLGFSSLEAGSAGVNTRNFLVFESPSNTNGTNTGAGIDVAGVWNRALSATEVAALSAVPVPEPSTLALLGIGALSLAIRARRRRAA